MITGSGILFYRSRLITTYANGLQTDKNPIEFKVALIFFYM
ncbi:MAG: hypothetical protein WCI71_01795 [Bacteroidota bacterium]